MYKYMYLSFSLDLSLVEAMRLMPKFGVRSLVLAHAPFKHSAQPNKPASAKVFSVEGSGTHVIGIRLVFKWVVIKHMPSKFDITRAYHQCQICQAR